MNRLSSCVFLLFLLVFTACAPKSKTPEVDGRAIAAEEEIQNDLAAQLYKERLQRLVDLGDPLLRNNVEICGAKTAWYLGAFIRRSGDLPERRRVSLAKALHLGPNLTVTLLPRTGPAFRAGLREGDEVVAVNGREVPCGGSASRRLSILLEEELEKSPVLTFKILRNGVPWSFVVRSVKACDMPLGIQPTPDVNARATGDRVFVTQGMLQFASDDELVQVIGHEMAHNAMMHIENNTMTRDTSLVLDELLSWLSGVPSEYFFTRAGANLFSHAQEFEADYVGMYIAARGGYAVDKSVAFWRKMAADLGGAVEDSNSHPNSPERYLKIQATADEIWLKQQKGEVLLPEVKGGGPFRAPSLDAAPKEDKKTADATEPERKARTSAVGGSTR